MTKGTLLEWLKLEKFQSSGTKDLLKGKLHCVHKGEV